MKRLYFTLFAAIVLSTMLHAQNNNLIIYSQDGLRFTVVLNGIRQNTEPETNVKITGLNAPTYKVKVIFADKTAPDIDQTVYCMFGGELTKNTEYSSAIILKKGNYKLQYPSMAPIPEVAPAAVPEQTVVYYISEEPVVMPGININIGSTTTTDSYGMSINSNNANVSTTITTSSTTVTTSGNGNPNGNPRPNSSDNPSPQPGHVNQNPNPNPPYVLAGYNGIYGCPMPMSPSDFASAKQSIKTKPFDDTRLTLAKQIIGSNCLLSSQIREMMELMSFEETKLDLAKYAWHHNLDKGNYYKLNDAFKFSSSIDELNAYTEEH